MSALAEKQRQWTGQEFLDFERAAQDKHEFVDGQIINMAGCTFRHALIMNRLSAALERATETHKSCYAFPAEMKIHIPASGNFRYADASIACDPNFLDATEDVLTNPCVIFEVLSKSTQSEDRSEKFEDYRSIPSFKEYVLIWQKKILVEHYVREADGKWNLALLPPGETLRLSCAPVEISVEDLYHKVRWPTGV